MSAIPVPESRNFWRQFFTIWDKVGILFVLLLVCAVFWILEPVFLTRNNLLNVIRQVSIIGIISVGMTFIILLGLIDLSVGSIVAFSGVIAASMQVRWGTELPVWVCMVASIGLPLLVGTACGFINGVISTKGKIHPFIVTLGTMSIYRGATLLIVDGRPISGMSKPFRYIGSGMPLGIPFPVILFLCCVAIAAFILRKTTFGRSIYAIGGNQESAYLSGIMVDRLKIIAFTALGTLSALAALVLTSRVNSAEMQAGEGYELDVIAAVVIGGTSMIGGEGGVIGTLFGALLIGVISNGLNLLGMQPYWQLMVKGAIIIAAVLLDRLKRSYETD